MEIWDKLALIKMNLSLAGIVGIATIMAIVALWLKRTSVNCMDLFTSPDGRLSRTAMGQTGGIVVAIWAPVFTTLTGKLDATVLAICLAYLGAVEGYAKYLRHKADIEKAKTP